MEFNDLSLLLLREDVGETYDAVARSAALAVGAAACHLALYDADTGEVIARRPRYTAPGQAVPQYRLRPSPASAQVIKTAEPYLSNDPARDPLYEPSIGERGILSILTVPVVHAQRILGLLYAMNKPGGFLPEDAKALTALAGAVAVTLENVRIYSDERERRLLNEGLRELSRALVCTHSEDLALGTVLDHLRRVIQYEAAVAVVLESNLVRVAVSRGGDPGFEVELGTIAPLASPLQGTQPVLLTQSLDLLPRLGLRGMAGPTLAVPLVASGEVLGAFLLVFDEREPTEREVRLAEAFADHAALFLESGTLLRREQQARARTAAAARITRIAVTRHEPGSLLQAVAPEILSLAGSDRIVIYLSQPRSQLLVPVAEAGAGLLEDDAIRQSRLDLRSGPFASLALERRPLLFEGEACARLPPFHGAQTLLALPLAPREEVLGAIVLVSLRRRQLFEVALVEFLYDVAQQVALGVENARLFAALSQLASTDELTQLANRRRFTESLRVEIARSQRSGSPVALVLADIDHLKKINDTYGHPAGDAAIRHVAATFRMGRRETDLPARLGGEEFALLLPDTDLPGAVGTAERLLQHLNSHSLAAVGIVTVSMGVAACPTDASSEEDLIHRADERLYAAKAAGRNRVCASTSQAQIPFNDPA